MEYIKKNKILLSIFALVLIVFAWYFLVPSGTPVVVSVDTTALTASSSGQTIVDLLNQVNSATIDTSFFSGSTWASLQDFSTPAENTAPGKPNLFTPISQSQAIVSNIPKPTNTQ